jgi:phospholipid/cholesterol/gamma-HCH transport system ATP-binding protein
MIRLEDITTNVFSSAYAEIKKGSLCKVITSSDYEKNILMDTMMGIRKPLKGKVLLFGKDIYSACEKEIYEIFRKISVVRRDGGLISNLKVWENIILPVWYHTGKVSKETEARVIDILKEIGVDTAHLSEYMGRLPGPLPEHEKRFIGLVRAMLMEPDLIINDSIFEGLNTEMAERLARLTTKFHEEKSGRTSVHISSDEDSMKYIKSDIVMRQAGKGFSIWT